MTEPQYARAVMDEPVLNPRIAYASWLEINFVPRESWRKLEARLDDIQRQAVHMAAQKLRVAGQHDAADFIDPGTEIKGAS